MEYEGFSEFEFTSKKPQNTGEVYVLLFDDGTSTREFYVGQTSRFMGRMDDYFWADDQASTDFKVGIAIRYFCDDLKVRVIVKHKLVDNPRLAEKEIIHKLKRVGKPLLNDQGLGYDYKTANLNAVRELVYAKCKEIANHSQSG